MKIKIDLSDRLKKLPPYLFVEIDKHKREKIREGRDIIDLGIGDPDQPTPDFIIEALNEAVKDPSTHHYALDSGMMEFKIAISQWYKSRFGVSLDPETEILPLIGSKDGIAHIPFAFLNPGDVVLAPNPGYPPYRNASLIAGGDVCDMPLLEENSFLPDLEAIAKKALSRAKLMFLNYPNNPTGAVCDKAFYKKALDLAAKNNIILCSDAAYTEISYDGYLPPSVLEVEGAKDCAVEFHSLSKTFNMTGWRIGMACGN
ncbi:MAG: aminotransferase class I/II-fold pyridoxal phosphate-dependent enzyme, partial [Candidatus Omnitrophota bacterium]